MDNLRNYPVLAECGYSYLNSGGIADYTVRPKQFAFGELFVCVRKVRMYYHAEKIWFQTGGKRSAK